MPPKPFGDEPSDSYDGPLGWIEAHQPWRWVKAPRFTRVISMIARRPPTGQQQWAGLSFREPPRWWWTDILKSKRRSVSSAGRRFRLGPVGFAEPKAISTSSVIRGSPHDALRAILSL